MDRRSLLRQIAIFADVTNEEADAVLALMREMKVKKGTAVFHQFEPAGKLYMILEGSVKVSRIGRSGKEFTVAVMRKGNFFGEMSLLDGQTRSAEATALTDCRFLVLDRDNFLTKILPVRGIAAKVLMELSKRLRAANQTIENLALSSVYDRVFHLLGHIGRRYPMKEGHAIITRGPTHQDLAEMVGASRETVSRTLIALEKDGLIEVNRRKVTLLPSFFEKEKDRW